MKPPKRIVVFEELRLVSLPIAVVCRVFGLKTFYINKSPKLGKINFFNQLEKFCKAKKYIDKTENYEDIIAYHRKAAENIEDVYCNYFFQNNMISGLSKILNAREIHFAYKKIFVERLRKFYEVEANLLSMSHDLEANAIIFIPDQFTIVQKYFRRDIQVKLQSLESIIRIPFWARFYVFAISFFEQLCWIFIFTIFPLWIFFKVKKVNSQRKPKKNYMVGLRVYKTDLSFFSKYRSVDFLLDNQNLKKEDVLFCIETDISDEYRKELEKRSYNVVDVPKILSSISGSFLKDVMIKDFLPSWFLLWKHIFTTQPFIIKATSQNLYAYLEWKQFCELYHLEHYVVYNDFGHQHVIRNTLLSRDNTKTWFYLHSRHHSDLFAPLSKMNQYCYTVYMFLMYDNLICWSRNIEGFLRFNHFGQYLNLGCLWSEHIKLISSRSDFYKRQETFRRKKEPKKTIAVFDTTFGFKDAALHAEDMVLFIKGILNLLNDFPDIQIVFKEKNTRKEIALISREVFSYYEKLQNHERCYMAGEDAETSEINAVCDLALSICFTSPTVEALGARKKGMYFDPSGKFRGTYYDQFPKLVAHDYEELKSLLKYWLYEISDDEFNHWINTYIIGEIDAFADGNAITRMREQLIRRNSEKQYIG